MEIQKHLENYNVGPANGDYPDFAFIGPGNGDFPDLAFIGPGNGDFPDIF